LGCALAAVIILVVLALVGVAMFLPPFSVGERLFSTPYKSLSAQSSSLSQNGLTLSVDPAKAGSGFGVRISAIASGVFEGQTAPNAQDAAWVKTAHAALAPALTLVSNVYGLQSQGPVPASLSLSIAVPQGMNATQLDLYRFDSQAGRWEFVPAQPSPDAATLVANVKSVPEHVGLFKSAHLVPVVGAVVDVGQTLSQPDARLANVIYPSGLQPSPAGTLQGVLPSEIMPGKGYAVIPVIRNFTNSAALDLATITSLLQNSALRAAHEDRLLEFATSKSYVGLAIDYRGLGTDLRDNFSAFISELAQKFHNANLTLSVVVPFPGQQGNSFDSAGYDWQALGASADSLEVLMPLDPQAFADNGLVSSGLRWAVGQVNRARIQIAVSLMSVQQTSGSFIPIAYSDALAPLGQVIVKPGVVQPQAPAQAALTGYNAQFVALDSSDTPAVKYFGPDGTLASTMWLTTGPALRARLDKISALNIAGIVALDLAAPGIAPDCLNALSTFKLTQPPGAQPSALALRWTVMANGKVLLAATAAPGTPFIYQADASNDSLVINAELVGASGTLGPAVLRVASVTPTPTTTPTSTPTPTNTPIPTNTRTPTLPVPATNTPQAHG